MRGLAKFGFAVAGLSAMLLPGLAWGDDTGAAEVSDQSAQQQTAPEYTYADPTCDGGCEAGCEPCYQDPCRGGRPAFFLRGEALWLQRNHPRQVDIARREIAGPVALTNQDGGFDYQVGPRLTLGYAWGSERTVELSYFGFQFWRATASAPFNGSETLMPAGPWATLLPLEGAFSLAAQYDSEATSTIHNAEINVRRQMTQTLSYLWGVRYINWHDRLTITALDQIPAVPADQIGTAGADTNNNLIGFQLGGGWVFPPTKKMQIAANFKAGVFGNAIDIHTYLNDPQNATQQYDVRRSKGVGAGVFEVNAELTYALRPSLVLRGGYNVMWLTNVALAGEQNPLVLNDSGTVFLHGPSAGIECRW